MTGLWSSASERLQHPQLGQRSGTLGGHHGGFPKQFGSLSNCLTQPCPGACQTSQPSVSEGLGGTERRSHRQAPAAVGDWHEG